MRSIEYQIGSSVEFEESDQLNSEFKEIAYVGGRLVSGLTYTGARRSCLGRDVCWSLPLVLVVAVGCRVDGGSNFGSSGQRVEECRYETIVHRQYIVANVCLLN